MTRSHCVLGCVLAVALSACGAVSMPSSPLAAVPSKVKIEAPAGHFRLLHALGSASDGQNPYSGVTALNGTLYGVTESGGTDNHGAVFSVSVTGKEKVLHSMSGNDGYSPEGALLDYDGLLYGTIPVGQPDGAVFTITPAGVFKIIFKFSAVDGLNPASGLIESGGMMYGTTMQGGAYGVGVVYAIDPSGDQHVVYSFGKNSRDASYPVGNVTFWKNKLYGASNDGGTYNDGAVYAVTTAGKETVLHSFGKGIDGDSPQASNLTPLDGALYGTTSEGGKYGKGVVFEVLPSGHVQTVYSFGGTSGDAEAPTAGVIAYRNALYGTTAGGGTAGQGAIFRLTPSGKETVLYSLSGDDGTAPFGRLTVEGSDLYGTTFAGGAYGAGTVFRFTP
jgi:uncharacterized repeat protein (TIGR03803 family)